MTQEEIQERNKQIALMLGVDVNYSTQVYRDSWNWLMEAIQFLHKHFESKEMSWTSIERYPLYTDIETVFVLVSNFAKHYNEGKL